MKNTQIKKIVNIVLNSFCFIIMIFILILTISTITAPKGMSSFLGYGYLTVVSDSMNGDNDDSFKKNDVIYVNILSEKEKSKLKVGDIITFLDTINGTLAYNTHRIIDIRTDEKGSLLYETKGDNNELSDATLKRHSDIIAKYVGQSESVGKTILWMQSENGYVFCVIIPGLLVFAYTIFIVISATLDYKKSKEAVLEDKLRKSFDAELREKLKQELLEEMKNNNNSV